MSLLYGQLDEMDSSLDTLQAEVSVMADNEELWTADDDHLVIYCWLCGTAVERRSLAGELSLSCARPAADG